MLETKNLQQTNDFQDNIKEINNNNDKAIEMMEVDFNSKLIFEYSKYEVHLSGPHFVEAFRFFLK